MRQRAAKWYDRYRRTPKALRWALWAVMLALTAYVVEDARGRVSLALFHAKWRDAGIPLRWQELPPTEAIPEEEDFLRAPFMRRMIEGDSKEILYAGRWNGSGTFFKHDGRAPLSGPIEGTLTGLAHLLEFPGKDEAEDAELYLAALASWTQLTELTEAAKRPRCGFLPEVDVNHQRRNSHRFAPFDLPGQPVYFRGIAHLIRGNAEAAAADVLLLFRFAEYACQSSSIDFRLTSVAVYTHSAIRLIWEGIARKSWTREHLESFRQALSTPPITQRFPANLHLSCAQLELETIWFWNQERAYFIELHYRYPDNDVEEAQRWLFDRFLRIAPRGTIDRVVLEWTQPLVECLVAPDGKLSQELTIEQVKALEASQPRAESVYRLTPHGIDPVMQAAESARSLLTFQQRIDLGRIAVALELHRLDRGAYPADLSPLAPDYLPALPEDRFVAGRPVSYELVPGARYRLFACGVDEIDDRGAPMKKILGSKWLGDIIWQFPAE